MKGPRLESILKRIAVLQASFSMPIAQLARRYVLAQPLVDKVIFGIKRPEHVREIISDVESPDLSQVEMHRVMELYQSDFGLSGERHMSY